MRSNPLLQEGARLFNQQKFFEAHETWEALWQELSGKEKIALQALIQVAVSLHLLEEKRLVGAKKVFQRALKNLEEASPEDLGLNYQELFKQVAAVFSGESENVKILLKH